MSTYACVSSIPVLGGIVTTTGIGAAIGVPVMVVSAVAANMAARIQGLAWMGMQNHDSDPKFMGGARGQPFIRMTEEMHRERHKELNKFLRPVCANIT